MNQNIADLQKFVTTQEPEKADVIVWLQGNEYDRGKKVLELYHQGFAPLILVTGNNERRVENAMVKVYDIVAWLAQHAIDTKNIILDAEAMNTADQALHVITIAKEQGWTKILLVASPHHQLRAFLTFLKQLQLQHWEGRIINQPVFIGWDQKPSGRRKTSAEAFIDEIEKVGHYKDHVASVEEGLHHLRINL